MKLWGFHGKWRIENEVNGGKKKKGKGSFAEVLWLLEISRISEF